MKINAGRSIAATNVVMGTPMEQWQGIFNLGLSLFSGVLGWTLRTMYSNIRELEKSVADLRENLAGNYITADRLRDALESIVKQLTRIEDKLDGKADK